MRISDWSSDVCSSDLAAERVGEDIGAHIADVRIVVDRWPARIETRLARVDGLEDFEAARQAVEQLERGGGNPGGGGVGHAAARSEERRVGKEWVSTCRSRWVPIHEKKNKQINY